MRTSQQPTGDLRPMAISTFDLNLGDTSPLGNGVAIDPSEGYGIVFSKRGSVEGARLILHINGKLRSFAPGDKIIGWFEGARVEKEDGCSSAGNARLIILRTPGCDYDEGGTPSSDAAANFVRLPMNNSTTSTYPSYLAQYAIVDVTGAKSTATLRTEGKRYRAVADVTGWKRVFVELTDAPAVVPAPGATTSYDVELQLAVPTATGTLAPTAALIAQILTDADDPNADGYTYARLQDSDKTAIVGTSKIIGFFLDLDGNANLLGVLPKNPVGGNANSAVAVRVYGVNK